jgi:hypothetical protein
MPVANTTVTEPNIYEKHRPSAPKINPQLRLKNVIVVREINLLFSPHI